MARKERLDVIINDMDRNPQHWHLDQFRATHRNGMRIWIGNGLFGFHVEKPNYYEPTFREKLQLRKALQRLRAQDTQPPTTPSSSETPPPSTS